MFDNDERAAYCIPSTPRFADSGAVRQSIHEPEDGQLVVLKSFRLLVQRRLNCFLERRLAGFNAASKTLTKHAHRTEFHCFREFVATAWAGALGFHVHGPNRPSAAI